MTAGNREYSLAAILLAAGPSSRLGHPKQLVRFEGETLVRRSARLLADVVDGPVVVVCGCESERVSEQVADLPVQTVTSPDWELGMGGSISFGARFVPRFSDGIMVAVCDQWLLSRDDLDRLLKAWRSARQRIHAACWSEGAAHVSGPPVIFPGRLHGELKGLEKSRGARQVIDRHIDSVDFIEMESASCDLDRPEDLARLLGE